MKPQRKNQASNFVGDSFSNRNDVRAPIRLHGQFCNVGFWERESFWVQLWKSILLQTRDIRPNLHGFGWGEVIIIFNYGCHKWMTLVIASIKYFVVVNFFDICLLYGFFFFVFFIVFFMENIDNNCWKGNFI